MWLEQYISKAVFRYEQLNYENERICMALEKAQIPFIPLKGSIIRKYYPESWMRTSCDVDVLVHEEDAEKAVDVLVKEYGYTQELHLQRKISGKHLIQSYDPELFDEKKQIIISSDNFRFSSFFYNVIIYNTLFYHIYTHICR